MPETEIVDTGTTEVTETKTEAAGRWQDTIAPESKDALFVNGRFKDDKDPSNLAKSYVELEKKMSTKVLKIPDDKSTPEEKTEFYKKMGRPDTADKYELKKPQLPAGMNYDIEFEKSMKEIAHTEGLSQKQLSVLADKFNEYQVTTFSKMAEANRKLNDERWTNLKVMWGENGTKENIELAKRCFDKFAPEELKKIMTRDDVIHDPLLVEMYSTVWRQTIEDTIVRGGNVPEGEYKPQYPDSPQMYAQGDDPESQKARDYFIARGHKY